MKFLLFITTWYLYVVGMNGILNTFFGGNRIFVWINQTVKIAMFLFQTSFLDNISKFMSVLRFIERLSFHTTEDDYL